MKHLFLPYELALIAKEKGFDEEHLACWEYSELGWNNYFAWGGISEIDEEGNIKLLLTQNALENHYDNVIKAPLYQQIVDWFREKHSIDLHMDWSGRNTTEFNYWHCKIFKANNGLQLHINKTHYASYETIDDRNVGGQMVPKFENLTYYQCLTKAIEEAFKLIK